MTTPFRKPLGSLPVLQYITPDQLLIDPGYQRAIEARASQRLIRAIAADWNWDLCQPLVVSRREDGRLFVVDGQHRLVAAQLRGDIAQLPCVVGDYGDPENEARTFVQFNMARRPLSKFDIFRSALAGGDREARNIMEALDRVGMTLHENSNNAQMQLGAVNCIAALQFILKTHGQHVLIVALDILQEAYKGQVLRYGGTLLTGIAALVADRMAACNQSAVIWQDGEEFELVTALLAGAPQSDWYLEVTRYRTVQSCTAYIASRHVFAAAWAEANDDDEQAGDEQADDAQDQAEELAA